MASKAVSDTGPIIHLGEINLINTLKIFEKIIIPEEVLDELKKNKTQVPKSFALINLKSHSKDIVKILTNQHNLDIGEAEAIALALQENADYFLTDDLEARLVAKSMNIETHGTIGIILRACREKIIDKKTAINKIQELKKSSSLFITNDLIESAIKEIEEFKK